jgi:hypothetical protein
MKPKRSCCQLSCLCLLSQWCLLNVILLLFYWIHMRAFDTKTIVISQGYQDMIPILPTFFQSLTLTLAPSNTTTHASAILFNKKPTLSQSCQWSDWLELKEKQTLRQYNLSAESRIWFDWDFEQAEVIIFNSTRAYDQWKLNGVFDSVDTWYYQSKMKHSFNEWISQPMTVYALVVAKDTMVGSKGALLISVNTPCYDQHSQLSTCFLTNTCTLNLPNRLDMVYLVLNASVRATIYQKDTPTTQLILNFKQRGFWSSPISVVFTAIAILVLLFTTYCCIKTMCPCSKPEEEYQPLTTGLPPLAKSRSLNNVRKKK